MSRLSLARLQPRTLLSRMLIFTLPPVVLAIGALTWLAVSRATDQERSTQFARMADVAQARANAFDAGARDAMALARGIGATLEAKPQLTRPQAAGTLERVLKGNDGLVGAYAAFSRDAFDGSDARHVGEPGTLPNGRFSAYWNALSGDAKLEATPIDESADYWAVPEKTLRPSVIEPYLWEGTLITTYAAPVIRDEQFVGVASVDRSLNAVDGDVAKTKLLDTGYAFMVSRTGIFLSALEKKLIGTQTLAKLAQSKQSADLERVARSVAAGRNGQLETTDPFTGKEVLLSWAPVATGGWGFVTAVPTDEIFAPFASCARRCSPSASCCCSPSWRSSSSSRGGSRSRSAC
jgi:methyl-accepting chemotaxis protein